MLTLFVEAGPDAGQVLRLPKHKRSCLLGAGPDAEVRIRGAGVADRHARIVRRELGGWAVLRLGPVQLRLNGRGRSRARLRPGDRLTLGDVTLRVAAERPLLRVVVGLNEGDSFEVHRGVTLGRSFSADVTLFDLGCSREHCRVERTDDRHYAVDLGSRNGTRLNGSPMVPGRPYALTDGDRLEAGSTTLEFVMTGAPASAPSPFDTKTLENARQALAQAGTDRYVRARNPEGFLCGDLERVGFSQIVQLLSFSKKSGDLLIETPQGRGSVTLQQGRVHDAWSTLASRPKESFFALSRLREGRFEFRQGEAGQDDPRIKRGTLALLMDAARLSDEG